MNNQNNQNNQKSDVEQYWDKVRAAYGNNRQWNELHPQEQAMVIQSINLLLAVLGNKVSH